MGLSIAACAAWAMRWGAESEPRGKQQIEWAHARSNRLPRRAADSSDDASYMIDACLHEEIGEARQAAQRRSRNDSRTATRLWIMYASSASIRRYAFAAVCSSRRYLRRWQCRSNIFNRSTCIRGPLDARYSVLSSVIARDRCCIARGGCITLVRFDAGSAYPVLCLLQGSLASLPCRRTASMLRRSRLLAICCLRCRCSRCSSRLLRTHIYGPSDSVS